MLPRLGPFALPHEGERAPELRVVLVADQRIGEVLERGLDAVEHDVGERAQHQRGRVLRVAIVLDGDVEHALGFGEHVARQVEARQIEPAGRALGRRRAGGAGDQLMLPLDELRAAVEAPELLIERHRTGDADAAADLGRFRQREAAGTADLDLVGRQLGRDIVGVRLDHHAVARGERAELDELMALHEAARRAEPGDDDQRVADVRVLELVDRGRLLERNGDAGARGTDDVAADHQRLGRILHLIAERDRPAVALGRDTGEPRPFELEANHLGVAGAGRLGAADAAARLVRQRTEIELVAGVEHQPQRLRALEDRGRRRRAEREAHADAVAMTAQLRHHRTRRVASCVLTRLGGGENRSGGLRGRRGADFGRGRRIVGGLHSRHRLRFRRSHHGGLLLRLRLL